MAYYLGIDLGTTYTAAAAERDGVVEALTLGNRTASVPSVVFLRDDGEILVGEAATRRATSDPGRVAREFKRRVGDPTPIILGGTPYAAEMLMARLLRWSVDRVREQQGEPPRAIALTHPANWGPYKLDLFTQAIRQVDLDAALMLPEPVAAATFYASQRRLEPGSVVAVYDLGGGTFDAAMVRRKADGFEPIGTPEGMERLGGIDFDEAVFAHVRGAIGDALERLDPEESAAQTAVARLRQECIDAKEALSSDTDVSIPVLLPGLQTEVRLTRSEFEAMIRPAISETIVALRRAIRSAQVTADEISAVLLVGGSSRIPLVAQMVGAELGRPIAIDAHPKDAIGFGAAIAVAERRGAATPESVTTVLADTRPPPPTVSPDAGRRPAPPGAAAAAGIAAGAGVLRPPAPGPGQARPAPPMSPAGNRPGSRVAPAAAARPAPPAGGSPRPAPPTARPGAPSAPGAGANPVAPAVHGNPAGPASNPASPSAGANPPGAASNPVAPGAPGNRPGPALAANPGPPGGHANPSGPAAGPGARPAPPTGGAMANRAAPGAPAGPDRPAPGAAPTPPGRPSGPTSGGYPAAGPGRGPTSGGFPAAGPARPGAPGAPTGPSPYQAGQSPYQGMPRAGGSPLGGHSSGGFPAMPGGRVTTGPDNKLLWIALGVVAAVALLVIIVVSMSGGDENGGGSTDDTSSDTSGTDLGSPGGESGYTAEVEAAFMGECTGAGGEQSACECAYDEVVATVPYERFVEIEQELADDPAAEPEELTAIISTCMGES